MNATYSPEDNKLRLYSETRLDSSAYERIKAAGFKWAPKQGFFVAPMWTPEREDLLIELCGEVGDEDKSLCERAEERAERFEEYKDKRAEDAERAHAAVEAITDGIPLGQPILVGHHSERHARKDAERIENGMRKAVKMWECSKYWADRAAGALRHAKYKELPGVRARRIKGLEADKRKRERAKAEAEHLIKFWEGKLFAKNPQTGERRPIEITEGNRALIGELLGRMPACGVQVRGLDGQSWFSAWDCLRPEGERYKNCPERTVAQLQESALRLQSGVIARCDRWIAHYTNRLAYERAMLEESGGIATDRKGPEKGGACKCWASHGGGFSYIVKVNRVSVTVLDNWGNGGPNFRRTIPFDKLGGIMTKAEVDAAREAGDLVEAHDKTGFFLKTGTISTPKPQAPKPEEGEKFDALKDSLKAGVQVVSAPQLFSTPPELARQVAEAAELTAGDKVLEPSAGTGKLVQAVRELGIFKDDICAVEINAQLAERLGDKAGRVVCADFLSLNGELGKFDKIVMNPPFTNGQDIAHIKHALDMLNTGGRLVAICANGPRQSEQLKPIASEWRDLPHGSFKESGTNVNAALFVYQS